MKVAAGQKFHPEFEFDDLELLLFFFDFLASEEEEDEEEEEALDFLSLAFFASFTASEISLLFPIFRFSWNILAASHP